TLGVKTEIKNMNSFRHIERALEVEIERQRAVLASGGRIRQATLRFDEERGETVLMREKEDAQDYRYFPDPDLPRIRIPQGYRAAQREQIPELPRARRQRLVADLGLPEYDARVLTQSRPLADYFEAVLGELGATSAAAKQVSNWIMGEVLAYMKAVELDIAELNLAPVQLADLLRRIESGQISAKAGKDVLREMLDTGHSAEAIIAARRLGQISDENVLRQLASQAISQNPKSVADFHAGKGKALDALVGQVMKATRGQANPQVVSAVLKELLASQ
ncbi:MAG: Asp-tRNA(Asn)/Glu-tRNA(Gln) amidotransferase GatCAB subunit B, partial [Firmicutes bacterium]|nr:Asp-tRNA(Asn)/Glu-tRNA(Gln) amidotransferase GatCAB subunit B [Bacillota bacterium]